MLTVVGSMQVPLCVKCTNKWWDSRATLLQENFEAFIEDE